MEEVIDEITQTTPTTILGSLGLPLPPVGDAPPPNWPKDVVYYSGICAWNDNKTLSGCFEFEFANEFVELFHVPPTHPAYDNGAGVGLRATSSLEPNTFIGFYAGEFYREKAYKHVFDTSNCYIMEPSATSPFVYDGKCLSNEMRYINDPRGIADDPNVEMGKCVQIDNAPKGIFARPIVTIAHIERGQELLLDYGSDFWRARGEHGNFRECSKCWRILDITTRFPKDGVGKRNRCIDCSKGAKTPNFPVVECKKCLKNLEQNSDNFFARSYGGFHSSCKKCHNSNRKKKSNTTSKQTPISNTLAPTAPSSSIPIVQCKICLKNLAQTSDNFYRDAYYKSGFKPKCKKCYRPKNVPTAQCTKCLKTFDQTDANFYRNPKDASLFRSQCKRCHNGPMKPQSEIPAAASIDISAAPATPNVVASTPNVVASTPNVVASTPNVVASTPNVVASTPNVVASTPNVVASAPTTSSATIVAATASSPKVQCTKCLKIFEQTDDYFYRRTSKNKSVYRSHCKRCHTFPRSSKQNTITSVDASPPIVVPAASAPNIVPASSTVVQCKKCFKKFKQTEENFHRHPTNQSGFRSSCKKCHNSMRHNTAPINVPDIDDDSLTPIEKSNPSSVESVHAGSSVLPISSKALIPSPLVGSLKELAMDSFDYDNYRTSFMPVTVVSYDSEENQYFVGCYVGEELMTWSVSASDITDPRGPEIIKIFAPADNVEVIDEHGIWWGATIISDLTIYGNYSIIWKASFDGFSNIATVSRRCVRSATNNATAPDEFNAEKKRLRNDNNAAQPDTTKKQQTKYVGMTVSPRSRGRM